MAFSRERICQHCGEQFVSTVPNKKYCGEDCSDAARRLRAEARYQSMPKRACRHCGREFKPTHKEQKYCARACGGKEYNKTFHARPPAEPMQEVNVLITQEVPVFPHLRPVVGKVYRALKPKVRRGHQGFYYLVDIQCGGYGLIVRESECVEVKENAGE